MDRRQKSAGFTLNEEEIVYPRSSPELYADSSFFNPYYVSDLKNTLYQYICLTQNMGLFQRIEIHCAFSPQIGGRC